MEILSLLSKRLGDYIKSEREARFCCPFCDLVGKLSDKNYHLYINIESGLWFCQRCQERGNLKRLLWLLKIDRKVKSLPESFEEELNSILEYGSKEVSGVSENWKVPVSESLFFVPYKESSVCRELIYNYLVKERCLLEESIIKYNVGMFSTLSMRIVFPEYWEDSIVYWTARAISKESKKKYLNCSKPRRENVYGLSLFNSGERIVVTEGVISAIAAEGVATYGKYVTLSQIERIVEVSRKICVALDGDAEEEAFKICKLFLCMGAEVSRISFKHYEDPASVPQEILKEKISSAKSCLSLELLEEELKCL